MQCSSGKISYSSSQVHSDLTFNLEAKNLLEIPVSFTSQVSSPEMASPSPLYAHFLPGDIRLFKDNIFMLTLDFPLILILSIRFYCHRYLFPLYSQIVYF